MTATADIGNEIAGKPISELSTLVHDRQVSCVEVTQSFLDRIDAYNARVDAYVTVTAEQALATAAERDEELSRGEDRGALHGIPIGHKDLYWTKGVLTTGCSKVLEDWVPDEDATVVTKWHDAGTVMLGKLNTHEFAYGSTSLPSLFGPSRNPWDPDRITGGSSGGSAAATIMGLCAGSTGSDSGGSIRMPSGACGTVGLKPTFGLGSRHGILPLMWSMDHPGPITTTVRDAALLMGPTAGYDVNDRTTVDRPEVDYTALLGESLQGKRIGVPTRYFYSRADPEVVAVVHKALSVFLHLGAEVEEVELDYIDHAGAASAVMHPRGAAGLPRRHHLVDARAVHQLDPQPAPDGQLRAGQGLPARPALPHAAGPQLQEGAVGVRRPCRADAADRGTAAHRGDGDRPRAA